MRARDFAVAGVYADVHFTPSMSNLQIAQRLCITEGTTQNHLSHIMDKLGLTSRTQVVAWVLAVGDPLAEPASA